jgi:hypothetical protein
VDGGEELLFQRLVGGEIFLPNAVVFGVGTGECSDLVAGGGTRNDWLRTGVEGSDEGNIGDAIVDSIRDGERK